MAARHSHDARCSCGNLRESLVITVICRRTVRTAGTMLEQLAPASSRRSRTESAHALRAIVDEAAYFLPKGSKLNFWPPTLASAIRPPFSWVKTATPSWYLASFDAPAEAATALT